MDTIPSLNDLQALALSDGVDAQGNIPQFGISKPRRVKVHYCILTLSDCCGFCNSLEIASRSVAERPILIAVFNKLKP